MRALPVPKNPRRGFSRRGHLLGMVRRRFAASAAALAFVLVAVACGARTGLDGGIDEESTGRDVPATRLDASASSTPNASGSCPSLEAASGASQIGAPKPAQAPSCDGMLGTTCDYWDDELAMTCACRTTEDGPRWLCEFGFRQESCPEPRPQLGDACSGTQRCIYYVCDVDIPYGTSVRCNGTSWEPAEPMCR